MEENSSIGTVQLDPSILLFVLQDTMEMAPQHALRAQLDNTAGLLRTTEQEAGSQRVSAATVTMQADSSAKEARGLPSRSTMALSSLCLEAATSLPTMGP